jgi:hypothetical protein
MHGNGAFKSGVMILLSLVNVSQLGGFSETCLKYRIFLVTSVSGLYRQISVEQYLSLKPG